MTSLATIHHKAAQLDRLVELAIAEQMARQRGRDDLADKSKAALDARLKQCIEEARG